jgi:hypothetical protein
VTVFCPGVHIGQAMAGHSNAKTAALHDRRNDDISLSEVERIGIWLVSQEGRGAI